MSLRKAKTVLDPRFRAPYALQISVIDESMIPAFPVGSLLECVPISPHRLNQGKAYVFETGQGFRLATFEHQDKKSLHLSCQNQLFGFIEPIRKVDLLRVYKVEYIISKLDD